MSATVCHVFYRQNWQNSTIPTSPKLPRVEVGVVEFGLITVITYFFTEN